MINFYQNSEGNSFCAKTAKDFCKITRVRRQEHGLIQYAPISLFFHKDRSYRHQTLGLM